MTFNVTICINNLAGDWFCSSECKANSVSRGSKKQKKPEHDYVQQYTCAVVWQGLLHQV